jgi:hypothetical protein
MMQKPMCPVKAKVITEQVKNDVSNACGDWWNRLKQTVAKQRVHNEIASNSSESTLCKLGMLIT